MPRRKSTNKFNDYIRVSTPDKEALSLLTKKAIGERSLSEFSVICGVSKSTLSRIISQQFKNPSSADVIAAIADHAESGSNITREMFFTAQGLMPLQISEQHNDTIISTRAAIANRSGSKFEIIAQSILQDNLLETGYNLSLTKGENIISISSLRYKADFFFETSSFFHDEINKWAFDVHLSHIRPVLHKLSWIFGLLYLDSLIDKHTKFSLVIDSVKDFEEVKSRFSDVYIKDLVSVILINICDRTVVDEFFIPTQNGIKYSSNFNLKKEERNEGGYNE